MIDHVLAATAAALVATVAAIALPRQKAAWRHALLLAGLLRFALPTAWIGDLGSALRPHLPARAQALVGRQDVAGLLLHPGGRSLRMPPDKPQQHASPWAWIWAAGTALSLGLWARGMTRRIDAVRPPGEAELDAFCRAIEAIGTGGRVELRIARADQPPGTCGWVRPVVLLPDGLSEELTAAELEAVLAHELAHVRRRDNLTAAAAHAVVCAFWFHPLLWWIERRMLAERETACDELALERGARPEVYLSGILKVCRLAFAGAAGYAGINGSNLQRRMEHIMSDNFTQGKSRPLRLVAAALFAIVALVPLAGGLLRAQQPEPLNGEAAAAFQQGMDLLAEKRFAEAEEAFRKADRLQPSSIRGLLGVVEAYQAEGRIEEGLQLLQQEAAKHPERTDLRLALGNLLVRARKYDLAVAEFQAVLSGMDPFSKAAADVYLRIGECYRRAGYFDSSVAALRRAKEIDPRNITATSTLALVLDAMGNSALARQEYEAVMRADPNNGVALNNLAYLTAEQGGDLEEATRMAERARVLLPQLAEVEDTLGWIYLKRRMTDAATSQFRGLVQKEPDNAEYRYHLGLGLEQAGDRAGAAQEFEAALESHPSEKQAAQIREALARVK
jgi:tetratricopeptide (TPR) repeat protein/Zn-dependent protease with chaperone function